MSARRRKSHNQRGNTRTGGFRGWVYVVSNAAFPGKVKIGFTTKDPRERVKEFNSEAIPHNYELEYEVHVEDPYALEQRIHAALKNSNRNLHESKEWFRLTNF